LKQLGQFVGRSVRALKADKAVKLHRLKSDWLNAVGPFLGSQTEPVSIKGDILYLRVSSSVWAQEINLQQRLIIANLKKRMSKPPKKIVCWVGEVHKKQDPKAPKVEELEPDESVPWKDVQIPAERRAGIDATLATIEDPGLRERMRKLMELSVKREIYLLKEGQLPCPLCGNFRPPEETYCKSCEREKREESERDIMRLLARKPWLTAKDVGDRLPLRDKATFMRMRKALLADWMLDAWKSTSGMEGEELKKHVDSKLRTLFMDITMLRCSLPVHSLQPKHFYFALGRRLAGAYLDEDHSSTEESH
jgi:Dna[CI] antecedent DciA-like protein